MSYHRSKGVAGILWDVYVWSVSSPHSCITEDGVALIGKTVVKELARLVKSPPAARP